jgi:hypothetical protein
LKKFDKWVSFKFPIALAAFLKAILSRLLPLGVFELSNFPPLTLLFGESLNQDVKCFAVSNL